MAGLSNKVRSYRFQGMRRLMRELGYDALAFSSAEWFEWASNHPVRELAWERPFLLIVTADGRTLGCLAEQSRNHVEAERRRGSLWIDEVTFFAESPGARKHGWVAPDWTQMTAEILRSAGLGDARIGVDTISEPLSRAAALAPGLRLHQPGEALRRLRWVKHHEEIATMRVAAALSDWAIKAYREELRPGCLLGEVDYTIAARLTAEAARVAPNEDFTIGALSTLSGLSSACPKGDGVSNGKTLENNTVAITTVATRLNGLAMELARSWLIGKPDVGVIAHFECALTAQEAAIDAAVAGAPVSGIHAAAQKVIEHEGFGDHLRLRAGHGIGVSMHDFPENLPFNDRELLANETYAIEPGLYVHGLGGFRFADVIAVRDGAPEHLTNAPKARLQQTLVG